MNTIYFGGGCFWCIEAAFKNIRGVVTVTSGYAGGMVPAPSYEQVCTGTTGHAEIVKVDFDESIVSLDVLLHVFFTVHDPTSMNRQGNDVGPQYRSIIFYTTPEQLKNIETIITQLTDEHIFDNPIVTEVKPLEHFYPAEAYHQDYYARNQNQAYCQAVINPKLAKLRAKFADYLR